MALDELKSLVEEEFQVLKRRGGMNVKTLEAIDPPVIGALYDRRWSDVVRDASDLIDGPAQWQQVARTALDLRGRCDAFWPRGDLTTRREAWSKYLNISFRTFTRHEVEGIKRVANELVNDWAGRLDPKDVEAMAALLVQGSTPPLDEMPTLPRDNVQIEPADIVGLLKHQQQVIEEVKVTLNGLEASNSLLLRALASMT